MVDGIKSYENGPVVLPLSSSRCRLPTKTNIQLSTGMVTRFDSDSFIGGIKTWSIFQKTVRCSKIILSTNLTLHILNEVELISHRDALIVLPTYFNLPMVRPPVSVLSNHTEQRSNKQVDDPIQIKMLFSGGSSMSFLWTWKPLLFWQAVQSREASYDKTIFKKECLEFLLIWS